MKFVCLTLYTYVGLATWTLPCCAQQSLKIDVHDPRPLNTALLEMEAHNLRTPLIYEEVAYLSPDEIWTGPNGRGVPTKYLRGGHFKVQIPSNVTDWSLVMRELVTAYRNQNLPGVYQVVQRKEMVEILPLQHKSEEGKLINSRPVLKTHITFPVQSRSIMDTAQAFVDGLSKAIGKPVYVWDTFHLSVPRVEIGANDEAADDFLLRLNDLLGGITVHLTYEPNEQAYYLVLRSA